jgi:hypothetical protein
MHEFVVPKSMPNTFDIKSSFLARKPMAFSNAYASPQNQRRIKRRFMLKTSRLNLFLAPSSAQT